MEYDAWIKKVNCIFESRIGVGVLDLPDKDYRAFFESGITPEETCAAFGISDEIDWEMLEEEF